MAQVTTAWSKRCFKNAKTVLSHTHQGAAAQQQILTALADDSIRRITVLLAEGTDVRMLTLPTIGTVALHEGAADAEARRAPPGRLHEICGCLHRTPDTSREGIQVRRERLVP